MAAELSSPFSSTFLLEVLFISPPLSSTVLLEVLFILPPFSRSLRYNIVLIAVMYRGLLFGIGLVERSGLSFVLILKYSARCLDLFVYIFRKTTSIAKVTTNLHQINLMQFNAIKFNACLKLLMKIYYMTCKDNVPINFEAIGTIAVLQTTPAFCKSLIGIAEYEIYGS